MLSPPKDTPVFCKFLRDNTKESSEIWRDGSHWLTESYYVVFMGKTYCSELKIEFNDFTVSLRGGWLYLIANQFLQASKHHKFGKHESSAGTFSPSSQTTPLFQAQTCLPSDSSRTPKRRVTLPVNVHKRSFRIIALSSTSKMRNYHLERISILKSLSTFKRAIVLQVHYFHGKGEVLVVKPDNCVETLATQASKSGR